MKKFFLFTVILMASVSSFALFRAYDQVFILAAANAPGGGGTYWNTDLYVNNPGLTNVLLTIEYFPSGLTGNAANRIHIDWADPIAPGATLFIPQIIKNYFSAYGASGALVLYGENPNGDAAAIIAFSRTYTPKNTADPTQGSYGQGIPGVPSFYYIDSTYASKNLDAHWIFGLEENADFRSNVGFVNGSQDYNIVPKVELYDATGAKVGEKTLDSMGALSQIQVASILSSQFGITNGANYSLRVTIGSSEPLVTTPPYPPALFTYGSKVSNGTGDPTYLEATYATGLSTMDTIVQCIWPPQ